VGGIWFYQNSTGNRIDNAIIKNAYYGIQVGKGCELDLTNTEIYNHSGVGLYAATATVNGYNNVVSNCGVYSVALVSGGDYNFRHCTFTNYWADGVRQTPTLVLNNYDDQQSYSFNTRFGNCIIYGNIDGEIGHDLTGTISLNYDHCVVKVDDEFDTTIPGMFTNCIINPNKELEFISTFDNDFHLDTLTVAEDAADPAITSQSPFIDKDNDGNPREVPAGSPDIGAYERQW
jgi:hypothetical protein